MLFVNDMVLVKESKERKNIKLEMWWKALEFNSYKLSDIKMEYMK